MVHILLYFLDQTGYPFPQPLTAEQIRSFHLLGFTALACFLTFIGWLYETARAEALQTIYHTHTELRDSEERFRTLADLSPVGIYRTDTAGACTYFNKEWCRIYGRTPEQGYGNGWAVALHPEDRQRVQSEWAECVQGQRSFSFEFRILQPDGVSVWVLGRGVKEIGSSETTVGYIGTLVDISDRKEVEEILRHAKEAAEDSNQAKSTFLANMSHEPHTPLHGILSFSEQRSVPNRPHRGVRHEEEKGQNELAERHRRRLPDAIPARVHAGGESTHIFLLVLLVVRLVLVHLGVLVASRDHPTTQ